MAIAQNKKSILALVGILLVGILLVVLLSASMGCDCGCDREQKRRAAEAQARQARLFAEQLAAKQPPIQYVHLNPLLFPPIDVNPNTLSGDTIIIPSGGPGGPGGC
jgi:hypothetical protein